MSIQDDIKTKEFKRVYLIHGDDDFARMKLRQNLVKALAGDDTMNFMQVSGSEYMISELREFTDTMPFFADRRVLLLEDTGAFKLGQKAKDTEGEEPQKGDMAAFLESIPDTATVVFSEQTVDKRSAAYKVIMKNGLVQECAHPTKEQLKNWLLSKIGAAKKNITRDAFELFTDRVPLDYAIAQNELEKLLSFAMTEDAITLQMVEQITTPTIEDCIFDMVEAVSDGKREQALKFYYDLVALKEEPLKILALVGKQFLKLSVTRSMMNNRASDEEIVNALSLNPRILWKFKKDAQRFTEPELQSAVAKCTELEKAVKSGDLNDTVSVELLIFTMTEKRQRK